MTSNKIYSNKTILAIDTASQYLSIALEASDVRWQYQKQMKNCYTEELLLQISRLLHRACVEIKNVDYIVYNQGPGSFTGLRVGLSTCLGIALGNDSLLIPVPSFILHADSAFKQSTASQVAVALDARLKQIYYAVVSRDDLAYIVLPQLISPEHLLVDKNLITIGDGLLVYQDLLPKGLDKAHQLIIQYPSALNLLELAKTGEFPILAPQDAELMYLRNKVALDINEQQQAKK